MLFDYENEDDARTHMNPKLVVELVGVSEWDGKGRANNYPAGLLLVTRTRRNYYASCSSVQERDEWVFHFRKSLECIFANNEIAPFKPCSIIQTRSSADARNSRCPKTDYAVTSYSPKCGSCGRRFYSSEYVTEACVLSQFGCEEPEKVCVECKNVQMCIFWLKTMNYVQTLELHEMTDTVLKDVKKFNASFQLRRRLSQRLDMAGELFASGNLTSEEFEELRSVDHAYRREVQHDECLKLKQAIETFGEDMQTIINILLNGSMTSKGGRNAYYTIILRILELADQAPDLVDFYFPQLYQIHLQQLLIRTPESYMKIDCLQQALLVLSQKYPSFGMKLAWSLLATVGDFQEKRASQVQYAACMVLLLQLEMVTTGHISVIADVPTSRLLSKVLQPASHQQQEIGFEIGTLFIIRRKLQEAYDEEESARKDRNAKLYGAFNPDLAEEAEIAAKKSRPLPIFPGANHRCSCLELLYHLGVGQAKRGRAPNDADSSSRRKKASDGVTEEEQLPSDSQHSKPDQESDLDANEMIHFWDGFDQQLDFLGRVNVLVESLRFIDRSVRIDALKKQVKKWNSFAGRKHRMSDASTSSLQLTEAESERTVSRGLPSIDSLSLNSGVDDTQIHHNPKLGWDPTMIAGEPQYRITRIIVEECRVFKTKARAPTLIVCEVMRDDLYKKNCLNNHLEPDSRRNSQRYSTDAKHQQNGGQGLSSKSAAQDDSAQLSLSTDESHDVRGAGHPHQSRDSMAKILPRTVVSNRPKADSIPSDSPLANPQQSMEDVANLIESSLNPVIAEMQRHQREADEEEVQVPEKEVKSPSKLLASNHPSRDNLAGNGGESSMRMHLPRRKSGGILPTNRLSSSTEGILRSSSQIGMVSSSASAAELGKMKTIQHSKVGAHNVASNGHGSTPLNVSLVGTGKNTPVLHSLADNEENSDSDVGSGDQNGVLFPNGRDDVSLSSKSTHSIETDAASTAVAPQGPQEHILSSAQRLLQDGTISMKEYEQLLMSDQNYREEIAREAALIAKSRVENVMGESFQTKKERILGDKLDYMNPHALRNSHGDLDADDASHSRNGNDNSYWPAYDLRSFIVKTNDDLRQEICCMQLMQIFKEIFDHFGLGDMLFLKPYRIVCTGYMSGVVEVLRDAVSLDALKRTPGFTTLSNHFKKVYDTSQERLHQAKYNFMSSLAAYSLFSYILLVKDRHNGNLLIDAEGHIIHIDFGFLLSIAPGGSFSVETAPFKLTEEMVELLDGLDSPLFGEFVTAFTKGFIALQANCENILSAITVLSQNSSFPCFLNKPVAQILEKLKSRFRTELSVQDAVKHCLDLITNSYGHYGTRQYDQFQYFSNGILP